MHFRGARYIRILHCTAADFYRGWIGSVVQCSALALSCCQPAFFFGGSQGQSSQSVGTKRTFVGFFTDDKAERCRTAVLKSTLSPRVLLLRGIRKHYGNTSSGWRAHRHMTGRRGKKENTPRTSTTTPRRGQRESCHFAPPDPALPYGGRLGCRLGRGGEGRDGGAFVPRPVLVASVVRRSPTP